jgi:hypothetical protein
MYGGWVTQEWLITVLAGIAAGLAAAPAVGTFGVDGPLIVLISFAVAAAIVLPAPAFSGTRSKPSRV